MHSIGGAKGWLQRFGRPNSPGGAVSGGTPRMNRPWKWAPFRALDSEI
jgi:hypothetical protein